MQERRLLLMVWNKEQNRDQQEKEVTNYKSKERGLYRDAEWFILVSIKIYNLSKCAGCHQRFGTRNRKISKSRSPVILII